MRAAGELFCIFILPVSLFFGAGLMFYKSVTWDREVHRCASLGGQLYQTSEGWACHKLERL
jgi:hypothetical protein